MEEQRGDFMEEIKDIKSPFCVIFNPTTEELMEANDGKHKRSDSI